MVLRRSLWERTSGYYEGNELRHGNSDWDFFISIAESGPFRLHHVPETLYFYRQHTANKILKRPYNEFVTRECIYTRHKTWFDALGAGPRFVADGYLQAAEASWSNNEPARAAEMAARAVRLCPPPLPTLPQLDGDEKEAIRLLARYHILTEAAQTQPSTENLEFNQGVMETRLGMMSCNIRIGRYKEAREHLEIVLGATLGTNAVALLPELLVLLALLCRHSDAAADADDALALALRISPGYRDAALLLVAGALGKGKKRLALYTAAQCALSHTTGRRETLEVLGMVAEAWGEPPDSKSFQAAFSALPPKQEKPWVSLYEMVYDFPLGRKLYWAYRAKDLYKTYGQREDSFDALIKTVELTHPQRILEIGCGNGRILELFSRLGIESVGQDISPAALELAQARQLSHVTLTDTPAVELDYPDGYFDLVISNRVLQHVREADARAMLAAMARMGKHLYINELRLETPFKENFYQHKHDYTAILAPLSMVPLADIPVHIANMPTEDNIVSLYRRKEIGA